MEWTSSCLVLSIEFNKNVLTNSASPGYCPDVVKGWSHWVQKHFFKKAKHNEVFSRNSEWNSWLMVQSIWQESAYWVQNHIFLWKVKDLYRKVRLIFFKRVKRSILARWRLFLPFATNLFGYSTANLWTSLEYLYYIQPSIKTFIKHNLIVSKNTKQILYIWMFITCPYTQLYSWNFLFSISKKRNVSFNNAFNKLFIDM